jgi:hypothetical protein
MKLYHGALNRRNADDVENCLCALIIQQLPLMDDVVEDMSLKDLVDVSKIKAELDTALTNTNYIEEVHQSAKTKRWLLAIQEEEDQTEEETECSYYNVTKKRKIRSED